MHVAQDGECRYIADKLRIEVKEPLDEPTITLGIAGLGTVGAGVVKIIQSKSELLRMRTGREIEIVAVSARMRAKIAVSICLPIAGMMIPSALRNQMILMSLSNWLAAMKAPPRRTEAALKSGKDVVTANKAMLAHHGQALAELAEERINHPV